MSTALRVEVTDGVAVVTFDLPGEPVNKFTSGVAHEFAGLLDQFDTDDTIRAAVLLSGKPDVWIAGADIDEFLTFRTAHDAQAAARRAQALFDRVEFGRVPIVCAIHGACLGGGLELTLACSYRIATDDPKTVLALPETRLGLIPGIGGTQRLPRCIGLAAALELILTAKQVGARRALRLGLVDEVLHPAILRDIALARAREFATGQRSRPRSRRKFGVRGLLFDTNPIGRNVVLRRARETAGKKSRGKYPALTAAVEAVSAGYGGPRERGYAEEARLFGAMAVTPESRELVFLFYATATLKKETGVPEGVAAQARPVERLGVLGAGFMGAGIAAVAAQQFVPVRLKDTSHDAVLKGLKAVRGVLEDSLKRKQVTRQQFEDQMSLVSGTTAYDGFGRTDLVIEAVFEDLAVKHTVLREIERVLPPHAVFATNTSTIPIAQIASASARPDRVVGMHFFSPVPKMPLLEIVVTPIATPEAVATAVAFGRRLGKTVILVNDSPGFFVNRILAPYVNEAGRLLDEGVAIDAVDGALVDFGFPVGPIMLLDEVGLDVAGTSAAILHDAFGDRLAPARSLRAVLGAGRLGRKGRDGFYAYDKDGKRQGVDRTVYDLLPSRQDRSELAPEEIVRRCILAMLNEAVLCLEEGIISAPRDGDVGAVFGIGFPPFRGGPFRYIDAYGAARIVNLLERLDLSHPGRYTPSLLLAEMARTGRRFYPAEGRPV